MEGEIMSAPPAMRQPAPRSALRRLVARHPVAAFLVMAYTFICIVALPPVRAHTDILPFDKPFWESLSSIFGVALPAFLVVAAAHGWAGVRDLARRSLRWRVGLRWYLVALFGVPVATVLCASVIFGLATTTALDRVVQSCRGDRLYGLLAGEPSRLARTVEGQLDRYGPLRAVASAELDGRQRIRPRPASHRLRIPGRPGGTVDVRACSHDVAVQRHRIQRAAGGTVPLLL